MADESLYSSSRPENKRKFDDPSPPPPSYNSVAPPLDSIQLAKLKAQEIAAKLFSDAEAKRPKVDNGSAADDYMQKPMGQHVSYLGSMTQAASYSPYGYGTSKKIDIPNGRVGVIIGRSGETIKYLQQQSGAKIQVTRDMDADPSSQTRAVEITGTSEQINRAEQLITDVLAEAAAGGSGTTSARKFGGLQSGGEQYVTKIPNNKVGLIIGKGGETIKTMQANTGARIQVIPLHLPPGDTSTERTLQIDGTNEQIEAAKMLVNEIVNSERGRNPQMGGYRPPRPQTNWGPPPPIQQPGYGYTQPGAYPGAPPQYNMPQPPYGSYPPQPQTAASTGYSTGYDQSSTTQGTQQTTAAAGYDYYGQQQQQTQQTYGQDGYATNYNVQSGYAQGYDQSYGSAPAPAYGTATAKPTQDGSAPTYAAAAAAPGGTAPAPVPPTQQPGGTTPTNYPPPVTSQPGYGPTSYVQSPQGPKPPSAQPVYGQTPTSQAGYAPPGQQGYGQMPQAQSGYVQPYQQAQPQYGGPPPPASQAGYGYGVDSYGSGGYPQPAAYGSDGGAAPTVPSVGTKAPQS